MPTYCLSTLRPDDVVAKSENRQVVGQSIADGEPELNARTDGGSSQNEACRRSIYTWDPRGTYWYVPVVCILGSSYG